MKVDVLVDVQRGDCGKGKISKALNDKHPYSIIAKYNGGGNAGHGVWVGNKKYTTHYLTSGIYDRGAKVVIGAGCVVNPKEFINEYEQFVGLFALQGRVFIHPYAHIVTDEHVIEDSKDTKIGTTKKGIGPAYRDKYSRIGIRANQVPELQEFLLKSPDIMDLEPESILMEGSQGWWLDIDYGSYPYVTSSHIHPAFAFATFALPLKYLNNIYGVCKIYETYVGNKKDLVICDEKDAELIREAGDEYGATTGRPREIGYLNLNDLTSACNQCGVNTLFVNKCDILEKVEIFKVIVDNEIIKFNDLYDMKNFIEKHLMDNTNITKLQFSYSKNKI